MTKTLAEAPRACRAVALAAAALLCVVVPGEALAQTSGLPSDEPRSSDEPADPPVAAEPEPTPTSGEHLAVPPSRGRVGGVDEVLSRRAKEGDQAREVVRLDGVDQRASGFFRREEDARADLRCSDGARQQRCGDRERGLHRRGNRPAPGPHRPRLRPPPERLPRLRSPRELADRVELPLE